MPSQLPGYEYDIFISYRHNDNRSGWVTEFVAALQEELAATIKDSLSIYFDKNPHDGLLETHSVDKSLERKLKCLIFIPIISQTYCDPKSFAWQHEFCAFNKLTKEDAFGRDVRLSGGNVASRILPVKIHDIDAEDKALLENELGGVLRAVDFIYKEAGVNRPLRSNEENPTKNQNQTVYRNQVNKVANAIKEIISSLKNPVHTQFHLANSQQLTAKSNALSRSTIAFVTVAIMAVLAVIFSLSPFTGSSDKVPQVLDKSIAVLPFADLSPDGDQEYLGDGISEEIINVLAQSPDLKVIARSSSFQFKGKNEDLRAIGKMLGVSTILEGSVRKYQDQVRVTAQLIKVSDGSHFWSKNFDQNTDNIFVIQDGIAAEVASALKATLLGTKTSAPKIPWNEESQRLYQQGRYFYDRLDDSGAHELLKRSVALDSNQAIAHLYLSFNYANLGDDASSNLQLEKTFKVDPSLPEAHTAQALKYLGQLKFDKALPEINLALRNGANNPVVLRNAARIFQVYGKSFEATAFAKKAVELDPLQTRSKLYLTETYFNDRKYLEALEVIKLAGDQGRLNYLQVVCLLKLDRLSEAEAKIRTMNAGKDFCQVLLNGFKGVKDDALLKKRVKELDDSLEYGPTLAMLYANSGDANKAIMIMEKAAAAKYYQFDLAINPMYDPLRKDPRFINFLERMKYPFIKNE